MKKNVPSGGNIGKKRFASKSLRKKWISNLTETGSFAGSAIDIAPHSKSAALAVLNTVLVQGGAGFEELWNS
ncbi:hypothetical protein [Chlorobaculum sp. 24CR]|uniref:hypothetical protein n=1 Tax=Chlorobaculum sp. 24CR TaxID=2508878 RepID=UPI00143012E1|nr:hypothetical protein [Chlorobaculum sp. 24CR]